MALSDSQLLEDGLSFTQQEFVFFENLLAGGDRGGFYGSYAAAVGHAGDTSLNGETEAVLQAKIATFSGEVGAIAYFSNAIIQKAVGTENYPGIYALSQSVADQALFFMENADVSAGNRGGVLSEELFYESARDAWENREVEDYFPGNLLDIVLTPSTWSEDLADEARAFGAWIAGIVTSGDTITAQTLYDFVAADGGTNAGFRGALLASLVVVTDVGDTLGKSVDDYRTDPDYNIIAALNGDAEYAVSRTSGKVVAVSDVGMLPETKSLYESLFDIAEGVVYSQLVPALGGFGTFWVMDAVNDALLAILSDVEPQNGDWTLLTESTTPGVYDGDFNDASQENEFADVEYSLSGLGTSGGDVLFGNDGVGQAGADVLSGLEGDDALHSRCLGVVFLCAATVLRHNMLPARSRSCFHG